MESILAFLLGIFVGFSASSESADKPASNDVAAISTTCKGDAVEKEECIIRLFRDTQEASVIRGKLVYNHYCILCHGYEYDGKGRAAKLHTPPPSNLILSGLPKSYVQDIVRKGGEGVGRYKGMPPWGEQLTEEQQTDIINLVMMIRK